MFDLSRTPVLCRRCQSLGRTPAGEVCPACGGKGVFQRLIVPIKIVAALDLPGLSKPASFQRLAVLSTEHHPPHSVLRGVRNDGAGLVTAMSVVRFAEVAHVEFVEASRCW